MKSGYGATLRLKPLAVIGYYYEEWPNKAQKVYETPIEDREQYDKVVSRIKKQPFSAKEKDERLFLAFKPQNA